LGDPAGKKNSSIQFSLRKIQLSIQLIPEEEKKNPFRSARRRQNEQQQQQQHQSDNIQGTLYYTRMEREK
jgi:hypothetical protein